MTRILVQRGSASTSNPKRSSSSTSSTTSPSSTSSTTSCTPSSTSSSSARTELPASVSNVSTNVKDEENGDGVLEQVNTDQLSDCSGSNDNKGKWDDILVESNNSEQTECLSDEINDKKKVGSAVFGAGVGELVKGFSWLRTSERHIPELEGSTGDSVCTALDSPRPPPPPVPPPKPLSSNSNQRRAVSGSTNAVKIGSSRRSSAWPVVSNWRSPAGPHPTSPSSHNESEGYNSADEQNPCYVSSYDDFERERQFEIDIRRVKGFEVKRMLEDGNCLFRAVADQVYGDSEAYDLVRQMCIDYMERERDHFSQFITEGFTSYCKRKRRDKVYGNNVEIQALSEMYNRPIHIYSYGTEPINIFHGSYNTDTPPIRLSYHHGNHYNSLVDPRRLAIGTGLGFSSLRGTNADRDQIKAAIKAQQDQQIDKALVAEGRFYSDLELTEKEIEQMVIEVSRSEYLADSTFKQQLNQRESSTSSAEPSSSGATGSSGTEWKMESGKEQNMKDSVLSSSSMQMVLSMGFSYLQVIEAYSIFGDDVDSIVCYILETSNTNSSRRKGKATE